MIESAKSAAGETQLINSEQFDREFDLEQVIQIVASENAELLERLTDDM